MHPMFVHLPIGLWILVPIADLIYLISKNDAWWNFGFWLLCASTIGGLLTVITGFVDALSLKKEHVGASTVNHHMLFMTSAWIIFAVALIFHNGQHPNESQLIVSLCLSVTGLFTTIVGGHLGAQLVYQFGVGSRTSHQNQEHYDRNQHREVSP